MVLAAEYFRPSYMGQGELGSWDSSTPSMFSISTLAPDIIFPCGVMEAACLSLLWKFRDIPSPWYKSVT